MVTDTKSTRVELLAITPDAEKLIEAAARTCYMSFDRAGGNTEKKLIRKLIRSGHHSVLEHAYATFRIRGASRAFTHQLVRHRLCAFSQESQRYVDQKGFEYVEPGTIRTNAEAHGLFSSFMEKARETYAKLQALGVSNQDARYVLPNAVTSEIVVSANLREWRHIFQVRCRSSAQWEIREVCLEMLKVLKAEVPAVFEDFVIDEEKNTAVSSI